MVSLTTAILACVFGLMGYFLIPVVAITGPVRIRQRVGRFYLKQGSRVLKQFAFIRRTLSGYDIMPIHVDNEQKLLKLTLSGSHLSEDEEYRFNDPDNRISRLFNKPVALAFELVPAAIDADLAEWGYWTKQKEISEGLNKTEPHPEFEGDRDVYDPYVPASADLRLVDPMHAYNVVGNDVDPENMKTVEKLTEKRYELYGTGLGIGESLRLLLGFAVGMGGLIVFNYVRVNLLDGGGGGAPVVGEGVVGMVAPYVADLAVVIG